MGETALINIRRLNLVHIRRACTLCQLIIAYMLHNNNAFRRDFGIVTIDAQPSILWPESIYTTAGTPLYSGISFLHSELILY